MGTIVDLSQYHVEISLQAHLSWSIGTSADLSQYYISTLKLQWAHWSI